MRKVIAVPVLALLAVLAATGGVGAISSYNAEPAPELDAVGAYLALWDGAADEDPDLDRFDWVCSGTMVDDDTFLTAAHCTTDWPDGTTHYVSLEQDVQAFLDEAAAAGTTAVEARDWALAEGYIVPATPHWDEAYPGTGADSHDIGVLEVDAAEIAAAWTFTPAQLPTAGQLDAIGARQLDALQWTVAGYGTEEAQRGPGGHTHPGGGERLKAPLGFNALNRTWVRLSMIGAQGNGGACYGDSGGPNFVELADGTLLLAATTITGDGPCYATNVAYRLDTASARELLGQFVALP